MLGREDSIQSFLFQEFNHVQDVDPNGSTNHLFLPQLPPSPLFSPQLKSHHSPPASPRPYLAQGQKGNAESEEDVQFQPLVLDQLLNPASCLVLQPDSPSPSPQSKPVPQQQKTNKKSYNTMDYIIKTCLRAMLEPKYQDDVYRVCQLHQLAPSSFLQHWRPIIARSLSHHIGINGFRRLTKDRTELVMALRDFVAVYLGLHYLQYLMGSVVGDKNSYLRDANKLLFISSTTKTKYLIREARQGVSRLI